MYNDLYRPWFCDLDPAALVYVRERGAVSDAVCVQSYDDAVATRESLLR